MKNITNFITESSKPLKYAKFEGIPGKVLYKGLIEDIKRAYLTSIRNGSEYLKETYDHLWKNADGNKLDDIRVYCITYFCKFNYQNKNVKYDKWEKDKPWDVTDDALNETKRLFKETWDEPVIIGERSSYKNRYDSTHFIVFKFPDGTLISNNCLYALPTFLKYAVEKDYEKHHKLELDFKL